MTNPLTSVATSMICRTENPFHFRDCISDASVVGCAAIGAEQRHVLNSAGSGIKHQWDQVRLRIEVLANLVVEIGARRIETS
jgi:hypothetical protein